MSETEAVAVRPDSDLTERLALRAKERNEIREYLINRGSLIQKSVRDERTNRVKVREIIDFAGLSDAFFVFHGKVLGCGPKVGAPETKLIRCVDAGCASAKSDQIGFVAVGYAMRQINGEVLEFSRSGHACPHTSESFMRDYMLSLSETRALSLTVRTALGIESATREEIGPDNPAARAAVMAEKWEDVPKSAACFKFLDGRGNDAADPFGFHFFKTDKGWVLRRRIDAGASVHPNLPGGCEFHGIKAD